MSYYFWGNIMTAYENTIKNTGNRTLLHHVGSNADECYCYSSFLFF